MGVIASNLIGKIKTGTSANVSISGAGSIITSSDTGSLLAVKYIKDDSSATTNPSDIGSIALKNWFAQYVGTLGKFNKTEKDNSNIKWGDYRGATILGFRISVKNESSSRYRNSNNAAIRIMPLNGDTTGDFGTRAYTVQVGGVSTGSSGGQLTFTGFNGGEGTIKPIRVIDDNTGVQLQMNWQTGYDGGEAILTGSDSVAIPGRSFVANWVDNNARGTTFSKPLFFFLGQESTRTYGLSS
tara:strand:+ start:583 stop:1305 length:723 start_codon:yes stop_codon:yes gene_type:complete